MTLEELIFNVSEYPMAIGGFFLLPTVLAFLLGVTRKEAEPAGTVHLWSYSVLVYWVCIPGIFAAVLVGYQLFFRRQDLLKLNILVYALPLISLGVVLGLIRWKTDLTRIPGFGRVSGLMLMLGISFAVALVIEKMRIFLFFGSSFISFVVMAIIAFALIRIGADKLIGEKKTGGPE